MKRAIVIFIMLACGAAPGRIEAATIGVILTQGSDLHSKSHEAFLDYLAAAGKFEKLRVIVQTPYPDTIAWRNAARKLIALDVDAIVTYGAAATLAASEERPPMPIVYAALYEPLTHAIKGKNVTGICADYSLPAMVRYMTDAGLMDRQVGVVYSAIEADSMAQLAALRRYAAKSGFRLKELNVIKPADVTKTLYDAEVGAFIMTTSSVVASVSHTVFGLARGRKIPTASFIYDDTPATIQISPDPGEVGREVAKVVSHIVDGRPAGSIPPHCARNVEIVFNLKEAQEIGLRIPMSLVMEATRIIK